MPLPQAQCQSSVFSYFSLFLYPQDIGLASLGASDEEIEKLSTVRFQSPGGGGGSSDLSFCPQEQPYLLWVLHTEGLCAAPGILGDPYDYLAGVLVHCGVWAV